MPLNNHGGDIPPGGFFVDSRGVKIFGERRFVSSSGSYSQPVGSTFVYVPVTNLGELNGYAKRFLVETPIEGRPAFVFEHTYDGWVYLLNPRGNKTQTKTFGVVGDPNSEKNLLLLYNLARSRFGMPVLDSLGGQDEQAKSMQNMQEYL